MNMLARRLIISEKHRQMLKDLGLTEGEVLEVIDESMAGKLVTLGRGLKRTERSKDGKYLYVEYVSYKDRDGTVELMHVDADGYKSYKDD